MPSLKGNSKNLKLIAQEFTLLKNEPEFRWSMDTVEKNSMTNYEFRISENPQSDLIKLQFQNMPETPPAAQYVILWKRIKSVWSTAGIVLLNNGYPCPSYDIGVAINGVNFYCGDVKAHNISYPNFGLLVQHRFQNDAHPNACPPKDPFTPHRLLGRMPRITDYSF
uniref:Uncharacterized protein n=1 Tax=Panagrolaimus superbus TaxID=310955 RepID=A0A914Z7B6_9BILA